MTATYTRFVLSLFILFAAFLGVGFPEQTSAASSTKPTCSLLVTVDGKEIAIDSTGSVYLKKGEEVRIVWVSTNATKAVFGKKENISLSGVATDTPREKKIYSYTFTNESQTATCSVTTHPATVGVLSPNATSTPQPALFGTASGIKSVSVTIQKVGSKKIAYKSNTLSISKGKWKAKISKKLSDGEYLVTILGSKSFAYNTVATTTLTIGKNIKPIVATKASTFVVSSVPLLSGGIAHRGMPVPIHYLQVTNVGKETASIKGFEIAQTGSALAELITELSVIDDVGGIRGVARTTPETTLFNKNLAFVTTDVLFNPGEMRLFTIKATLAPVVITNLGKDLKLQVSSVASDATVKGFFPIRGTTWIIAN